MLSLRWEGVGVTRPRLPLRSAGMVIFAEATIAEGLPDGVRVAARP